MEALKGGTRIALLGFFGSHIIFTCAIDGQGVFPDLYPSILKDVNEFYVTTFNDPLMGNPPLWLKSLLVCELLVQLPFFFTACLFLKDTHRVAYPDWFRCACIAYGGHTATTLIPILATVFFHEELTVSQKIFLHGVYLPYLIFPLWILYIAATRGTSSRTKSKGS